MFKFNIKMVNSSSLLTKPVSSSLLGLFRIFFGLCLVYEMVYYFNIGLIPNGLKAPVVLFPYSGFEWVTLLPGKIPEILLFLNLVAAVCITLGVIYRKAIIYFFFSFAYFFLLDKGFYNNHLYLFILLVGLMIFMPADAAYSLSKKKAQATIPYWMILLLRFQLFVVYFYGGLAKIKYDWLVLKEPMHTIFRLNGLDKPLIIDFIAYGGLVFDLTIGFLLCYKPTRKIAVLTVLMFNCSNAFMFNDIGVFPFFMIGATMLFFEPDYAEKWFPINKLKTSKKKNELPIENNNFILKTSVKFILATYVILQLVIPFRGWFITLNPDWYGPGQRFSWRMKMQNRIEKEISFAVFDMDNKSIMTFDPHTVLTTTQLNSLIIDPYMSLRFAQFLGKDAQNKGIKNVEVKGRVMVSFNGRPDQLIYDENLDLLKAPKNVLEVKKWVLPIAEK